MVIRNAICYAMLVLAPAALVAQIVPQPDQVLYDAGLKAIQQSRYERARLTLQTLINTYATSELLAPARLAVADSWYREGGTHGLAKAEEECNAVIAQFPKTSSAADAQKVLRKILDARAPK